jgi:hypothetical protein
VLPRIGVFSPVRESLWQLRAYAGGKHRDAVQANSGQPHTWAEGFGAQFNQGLASSSAKVYS